MGYLVSPPPRGMDARERGWDGESRVPPNGATGGSCVCSAPAQRLPRPVRGTRGGPGPAHPIPSLLSGQRGGFQLGKGAASPGTAAIAGPQRSRGRGKGRARVGARSSVSRETAHRCPRWSGPECPGSRTATLPCRGCSPGRSSGQGTLRAGAGEATRPRSEASSIPGGPGSQPGLRRGGREEALESVGRVAGIPPSGWKINWPAWKRPPRSPPRPRWARPEPRPRRRPARPGCRGCLAASRARGGSF